MMKKFATHRRRGLPRLLVTFLALPLAGVCFGAEPAATPAERAERLPHFEVPGREAAMGRLRELFQLHYRQYDRMRVTGTLWDGWIPMSTLWPALEAEAGESMRRHWRETLLNRRVSEAGYVSTHQHEGLAHSEGWPFPTWTQAGGVGWHFSLRGVPYGRELGVRPTRSVDGWTLEGAAVRGIEKDSGLRLELTEPGATVTTPAFKIDPFIAPFIRLEWRAEGLGPGAEPYLEWSTRKAPGFDAERRMHFSPARAGDGLVSTMIPVHRLEAWSGAGRITRLRIGFDNAGDGAAEDGGGRDGEKSGGGEASGGVTIKSLFTAIDSRHNINNSVYLQGCCDYVEWTGDLSFLRQNIGRMRKVLRYAMDEFRTREELCIYTPWVGHSGRPGFERTEGGKRLHHGRGVGNNYWDLMPFGGRDCLATIYYYDAVRRMAALERQIKKHPEWSIPMGPGRFYPDELADHAAAVRDHAGELFWNEDAGRFVAAIDLDGNAHDYGYTFLNNEAVHYGFATEEQADSIHAWISGERTVEGDTSRGEDIYRWRFAPRATTRRNIDYYGFVWHNPESIPWGGQVQDGGAVLGFSYHDLMARLKTAGPGDAWERLRGILDWFGEVQRGGGYRAYYREHEGTLQGGGTPGGLGLDKEFTESVMVPQVMLYGFLGLEARLDGLELRPALPPSWPSLTIGRIRLHGLRLNVKVEREGEIRIETGGRETRPLKLRPPHGVWRVSYRDASGDPVQEAKTRRIGPKHPSLPLRIEGSGAVILTPVVGDR